MTARERHPADIVRVVIGSSVFVTGAVIAHLTTLSSTERDLFRVINDLPDALAVFFESVMQLGTLWAVVAVAAGALLARKWWLAATVFVAGFLTHAVADATKEIVGRARPSELLARVAVRGPHVSGFGYPSTHTAVAAAIATAAGPYLPRWARRLSWVGVALVAFARLFVGAHFPLDVVGGLALGWTIGGLVHLLIGTPCRELDPKDVQHALVLAKYPVDALTRVADDGTDATPYLATTDGGRQVFVKALDREHRDADVLASLGRYVAFRHIEDESPFASARTRIEHEALLAALAAQSGVHAARPLAIGSERNTPSVLVLDAIAGRTVGEEGAVDLDDAAVCSLWHEVAALRAARIAHRHLSLNNVMLDDAGQPWIIGFSYAEAGASDRQLARDVAELLASLTLVVGRARAISGAVNALGKQAVVDSLPLLQPLALATTTRHALRRERHLLDKLRDDAADAVGVEHVKLEPLTRVRPHQVITLACFLVALYVLLPQVADLQHTVSATRHADPAWLVLALLASAGVFVGAALSLTGCVLVALAFGRTFVTQLASSFSNKITPAGLGGIGVNVRYLQRSGVSQGDALGAIALNGSVGFVVHISALLVFAVALGRTGLPSVPLPNWYTLLVAIVVVLGVIGIVLRTSFGRRHVLLPTERTARDLLAVVRRPAKATQMLGGNALILASYVLALGFALNAFHAHVSWLDIATVYLGGSAVASAAPTPGKVGAMEAALIAGLTRVGVASGPAVAGVLSFRLATFWLPIVPGWLAFRSLARRELL